MTVRSGGGPRDPRSQARPYDEDAYATEAMAAEPDPARYGRNHRSGGRGSHGAVGLVKFLVFTLILAAIVLVVSLTALRPVFNSTVLSWAAENPAALQLPFVKDLVREDLGAALTTPASSDSAQVEFIVESGDTASTIGARLAHRGPHHRSAHVRLPRHRPEAHGRPPAGNLRAPQEHDPGPAGDGAAGRSGDQVRRHRPADRPAPRADHGQARRPSRASRWTRRTSTTS